MKYTHYSLCYRIGLVTILGEGGFHIRGEGITQVCQATPRHVVPAGARQHR